MGTKVKIAEERIQNVISDGSNHLNLYNLDLMEIPDTIKRIKHLQVLNIRKNQIKEIAKISHLKGLKVLYADDNIIHSISENTFNLTEIVVLYLQKNILSNK